MKRVGVNSVVGIILIVFSLFWNTIIDKISLGAIKLVAYGPQFFPKLVTSGIIIISFLLIIQDILNKNEKIKFIYEKSNILRVISFILLNIIYIFVVPLFGYLFTTIVALAITLWIFGLKDIKILILISVFYPLLTNYIFKMLLKVGLP